jgi:hypothetical protein
MSMEPANSKSSSSPKQNASSATSAGILAALRKLPRPIWLVLSALVLVTGSLCWLWLRPQWGDVARTGETPIPILSSEWWKKPRVRNLDSALPDISARLFAVGVQPARAGQPARVWIAGAHGFLAYSEDQGQCWTFYKYDSQSGVFSPDSTNCATVSQGVPFHWPSLVPVVFAASPEKAPEKSTPDQQKSPAQSPTQSSAPASNAANQSAPRGKLVVSPTNIDFGTVYNQNTSALGVPIPAVHEFTVTNRTGTPTDVYFNFTNDNASEFEARRKCALGQIRDGDQCSFDLLIHPKQLGGRKVTLQIFSSFSKEPVNLNIAALVAGWQAKTQPPEHVTPSSPSPKPAAPPPLPASAPDLLAIQFSPDAKIVSTGGLLWTLTNQNTWVAKPVQSGTREQVAGINWILAGSTGKWANETHVQNPAERSFPKDLYSCTDCDMQSRASDPADNTVWIAGWTKDSAGEHAVLLHSLDKKNWEAITRGALVADKRTAAMTGRPWMWPPYWYWAVLLLSALLATPALLRPPDRDWTDPDESTGNVEGRLSSDKPLDPGDVDVLGLTAIALGLSRFLRNQKTLPPLTVAVNGEWGSGKSSLMNLLRCDLQSYGMRPVWFNAWHHQKEENLLAALLQTVRLEAVPPLWNLLGLPFRVRLLWYRINRRWPVLVFFAAVSIFLMVIDYHLRKEAQTDLFLWLVAQLVPTSTKGIEPISVLPIQGGLLALFATVSALWKGLTAFGANPASLLASVAKGNKLKDLEAQTSFRQKFAVEFRDFTRALGPKRPLVVFIDDLDRCLPENVREVLEAVNFLVASGDCFIVLGIDREQVQRAIGLSFKEVAEETGPAQNSAAAAQTDAKEIARAKRAEFAQKYLQKLINLEVRVPIALDDATKQRLFERPPEKPVEAAKERWLRHGLEFSRWGVPAVLTILLLVGAFQLSIKSIPAVKAWIKEYPVEKASDKDSKPPSTSGSSGTSTGQSIGPSNPASKSTTVTQGEASTKTTTTGILVSAVDAPKPTIAGPKAVWPASWVMSLPLYLIALFLLLVANVVLTTRQGVVTHDSQQFTDAMEKVWYPLVLAKQNTPRAAKRFVNRVRYLAMRQRAYEEQASWWDRVLFPQRLREPLRKDGWKPIPEPLLVAMAAIEQMESPWIYDQSAFTCIVDGNGLAPVIQKFPETIPGAAKLLESARAAHKQVFSSTAYSERNADWRSLPMYRDTFLIIWPRVDILEAG